MANSVSELTDTTLHSILPSSISEDEQLKAIADGLDIELHKIVEDVVKFLPYLQNLNNLPSKVIDYLAWQYHVDIYDANADIAVRRQRVRQALEEHRIHGTRRAVVQVLDRIFGDGTYTIIEWWEHNPKYPVFTYKVKFTSAFTQTQIETAKSYLEIVGNVRSHWIGSLLWFELDAFNFDWSDLDAKNMTWDQFDNYYFYNTV